MAEKRGLFICPHGGNRWRFNTMKWGRPINSYSGWSRYANIGVSFGASIQDNDLEALDRFDYFIIFSTTGHLPTVVKKLRQMFGDTKKICAMTDGYYADLAEIKIPEPGILRTLERDVDMILGNRPDSADWVPHLVDTPFHWLGFPIDIPFIDKIRKKAGGYRDPQRINVYHAWKAATMMRALQRTSTYEQFRFVSFKNPTNVFSNRRGWKEPNWGHSFGVDIEFHDDSEWSEYLKVMTKGYIGLAMDLVGQLGRFSTEMAALGIPCVGSSTVGRQAQLHPRTTVNVGSPAQMSEMVSLVTKLREDGDFYAECANEARENAVNIYGPNACLDRWAEFQRKLWS